MTREEAIDLLDNLIGMIEDNHNTDYDTAFKMAIKALEQEPFMNKPCVAHQVCNEDKVKVLNKIRAEIAELAIPDFEYHGCGGEQKIVELEDVFEIIDKYKAESETETWKGYHRNITAPKGTFDKIFNEANEEYDDI